MEWNLTCFSTFVFDLDGCIYSGNQVYPGSGKLLAYLIENGKQIFFLSNNSTENSQAIRSKLLNMGLPVENIPIFVATELVGQYLFENYGSVRVLPLGSKQLEDSLKEAGHAIVSLEARELCDFVVIGRDTSFTYQKLYECTRNLATGVRLIATNPDLYHPGEGGSRVPETGAIVAAIQAVSGISEVQSVGKPFIYPFYQIIKRTGFKPGTCVMVGDNPYTDVQGGHSAGMHTIWISHGQSFPDELHFQPDLTVKSMEELVDSIAGSLRDGGRQPVYGCTGRTYRRNAYNLDFSRSILSR